MDGRVRERLRDLGWTEGTETITIEYRWPDGHADGLVEHVADPSRSGLTPDVIMTGPNRGARTEGR